MASDRYAGQAEQRQRPFLDDTLKNIANTDLDAFKLNPRGLDPAEFEKSRMDSPSAQQSSSEAASQDEKYIERYEDATRSESDAGDASDPEKQKDQDLKLTGSNISVADNLSLPHEILFIAVVCLAQLMTQVSLGQTLALLHIIGDSFGLHDPAELTWLIAGYSLTVGTFILVAGRMGDVFGHKRMFIIGFCWFSLWTMIAGVSVYSNHVLHTFCRVLQGIGPAICFPTAIAILGQSYSPGPRKALAFSIFGGCAPLGSVLGSAFGGLLALAWWPWAFWSLSIALAGTAVLAHFVIPPQPLTPEMEKPFREKVKDLDLLGGLVGVSCLILFNFSWNQAPIVGWHMPYVIVTLILACILAPLFFYIEFKVSKNPLIPFDALSNDVSFVLACIACGWSAFGIWIFYLWQFMEVLKGVSPLLGSAYISPAAITGGCASLLTGWLLGKVRPAWVMVMAMIFFLVGVILIATAEIETTYWANIFVCTVVMPFGMDMSFPAGTLILSNATDKKHQGIAASMVATIVNYSISLGLGFAGTVEAHIEPDPQTKADTLRGYRSALYVGIGLAALGVVVSIIFLLKGFAMDRKKK